MLKTKMFRNNCQLCLNYRDNSKFIHKMKEFDNAFLKKLSLKGLAEK